MQRDNSKPGRVLLNYGRGKGKSTAAFGVLLRAAGWGMRICVIQFIKGKWKTGEQRAASQLATIEWHALGDGFTWNTQNPEQDRASTQSIWQFCQQKMASGEYDLLVFDEILYCLEYGWLDAAEVAGVIRNRPAGVNLILTGGVAPAELLAVADTATEMVKTRHAFDLGIVAERGVEF